MAQGIQIPPNPDAAGYMSGVGADVEVGPLTLYPPLRDGGRGSAGRTVSVRLDGTDYTTAVLYGRLDVDDEDDWSTVEGISPDVSATGPQLFLLPFDYAEIKLVTTGGDETSTAKMIVGP